MTLLILLLLAPFFLGAKWRPYPLTWWIIDSAHKQHHKITWEDAFDYANWTTKYSIENRLDQDWMMAMFTREDPAFDPEAEDGLGSYSIPQIQCSTAQQVAKELKLDIFVTPKLLVENPELAIRLACRHFRDLLDEFGGSDIKATRAYNYGQKKARRRRLNGLKYVMDVFENYKSLQE